MYTISKDFHFDYSHRVWVQNLREDFCARGDTGTKCRFIHGHTGSVRIWVEGNELNTQSMLCDFKELGFAKDFFDAYIDHKFILDISDPLFSSITNGRLNNDGQFHPFEGEPLSILDVCVSGTTYSAGFKLDVSDLSGIQRELYESFFLVDFVPTSENLSAWVLHWCQAKLEQINVIVSKVEWSETPKSRAVYTKSQQ